MELRVEREEMARKGGAAEEADPICTSLAGVGQREREIQRKEFPLRWWKLKRGKRVPLLSSVAAVFTLPLALPYAYLTHHYTLPLTIPTTANSPSTLNRKPRRTAVLPFNSTGQSTARARRNDGRQSGLVRVERTSQEGGETREDGRLGELGRLASSPLALVSQRAGEYGRV